MIAYIDQNRHRYGVEPICQLLPIAPSTYHAARRRLPSARALRDQELKAEIARLHAEHFVYGARKIWRQLHRDGIAVARCTVERLMGELHLEGVRRGKAQRTTTSEQAGARPADLVERNFSATRPNQLWVADLTCVATWSGFSYVALVIDAFSRFIVGWQASRSLRTDLALDALEMAIWRRQAELDGLVHHSDRGSQLGFKGSSQHCLVGWRVAARSGLRLGSSNPGSYGVGC
jgi:putative transposase